MSLPIALQLFSVGGDMQADFEGTLRKVKEMGYDGVEFAGLFDRDPAGIRDWCRELSLTPISAHVGLEAILYDTERTLDAYETIGVGYMAVPHLAVERRSDGETFLKTMEDIRVASEKITARGMTALYHNHDFEFMKIGDDYALDVLYSRVPPELLQTELDTCWIRVGGEDPADYIRKYAGRCPVVHIKDFHREDGDGKTHFEFRPAGHGQQNMPAIVDAAKASGAKWLVVEQDAPSLGKTPLECAEVSLKYLRSLA